VLLIDKTNTYTVLSVGVPEIRDRASYRKRDLHQNPSWSSMCTLFGPIVDPMDKGSWISLTVNTLVDLIKDSPTQVYSERPVDRLGHRKYPEGASDPAISRRLSIQLGYICA